nr:hypothetical protein [Tanacetum cinerariifolium]
TYTSISSDSDGPLWGIPLMNAGEFSEMDPYEEVTQQGQVHPLSPAYVPDPIELDEHVPVYVSEPEHPEYNAPSDDDIQVDDDDEDPERILVRIMSPRMTIRIPRRIPMRSMSLRMRILRSPLRVLMRLNRSRRTRLLSHHHHLDTVERGYLSDLRHPWPFLPGH